MQTKGYILIFLSFLLLVSVSGQGIDKKTISLQMAKRIAEFAETEAAKNNWNVVISIVDDGGNLIYLSRMDKAQFGSIEVSIQKARSAIAFKRPTKVFEDMVAGGRNVILSLPGALPIEGGIPLIIEGQFVGGIGVSGAKSNEDGLIAKAAVDFLSGL